MSAVPSCSKVCDKIGRRPNDGSVLPEVTLNLWLLIEKRRRLEVLQADKSFIELHNESAELVIAHEGEAVGHVTLPVQLSDIGDDAANVGHLVALLSA